MEMRQNRLPPGIMFYRDIIPIMRVLDAEQVQKIFFGAFDYAETGAIPDGLDGVAAAVWQLLYPKIDRDIEAYRERCLKNGYAAYKRWAQEHKEPVMSKEDWMLIHAHADALHTHADALQVESECMLKVSEAVSETVSGAVLGDVDGGSGGKGDLFVQRIAKEIPSSPEPMSESDFEERRRRQLERFRAWTG